MVPLLEVFPANEIKFERDIPVRTDQNTCVVVGKTLERVLKLRNNNDTAVAFKVKTTAPKRYCVRPNCSVVPPHESVEVTIVMQPLKELPLASQAPKDKFLIQGAKIGGGGPAPDPKAVFDDVDKSEIVDQRLVCTFEFPADRPLATVQEVSPLKPVAGSEAWSNTHFATGKGEDVGLQDRLAAEKRLSEKLAKDAKDAKDRALALERELSDEKANNRDTLRALEELQEKFKQLQARSKVGEKDSAEQGMFVTDAKSTTSPINNMLLLILVTLVCLLAMRVFVDVVPAQHQVGDL